MKWLVAVALDDERSGPKLGDGAWGTAWQQLAGDPLEVEFSSPRGFGKEELTNQEASFIRANISCLHLVGEFERYLHILFTFFDPLRHCTRYTGKILHTSYR